MTEEEKRILANEAWDYLRSSVRPTAADYPSMSSEKLQELRGLLLKYLHIKQWENRKANSDHYKNQVLELQSLIHEVDVELSSREAKDTAFWAKASFWATVVLGVIGVGVTIYFAKTQSP